MPGREFGQGVDESFQVRHLPGVMQRDIGLIHTRCFGRGLRQGNDCLEIKVMRVHGMATKTFLATSAVIEAVSFKVGKILCATSGLETRTSQLRTLAACCHVACWD